MAKRLLSLVVAMLLVLSLAPVALASTEAALAAVAAEAISDEPLAFVTKNLTLPTEAEGTAISWQSSDPSVIATDGTVTRHPYDDKTVTLTANIAGADPVTHEVTVLSNLKTVGLSDNYKVSSEKIGNTYIGTKGWANATANDKGTSDVVSKVDSNGNHYASVELVADYHLANFYVDMKSAFPDGNNGIKIGTSGEYVIEFDLTLPVDAASPTGIQFMNNNSTSNLLGRVIFRDSPMKTAVHNMSHSGNYWFAYDKSNADDGPYVLYYSNNVFSWGNKIHVKYVQKTDMNGESTPNFSIYFNDTPLVVEANATHASAPTNKLGFKIETRATSKPAYSIDNLVVYTEDILSDDMINDWNEEQKVEFFASKVDMDKITATPELVTSNLDLAAALTGYELANYGVTLTWTSSNPARITNAGVVDNTNLYNEDVTMTATVSCGEASVSLTKIVTVGQPTVAMKGDYLSDFNNKAPNTESGTITFVNDDAQHGVVAKITGEAFDWGAYYEAKDYTKRYLFEADLKFSEETGYTTGTPEFMLRSHAQGEGTILKFDFANRVISAKRGYDWIGGNMGLFVSREDMYVEYPMPASLQKDTWFSIAIDYVVPSRSLQIYINGECLDEIPVENFSSTPNMGNKDFGNSSIRGYRISAPANSSMYFDNVSLKQYTDDDCTKVDAALNAFKIAYLSNRETASLRADASTLPAAGPIDGKVYDSESYQPYNFMEYSFTGGAALSYKINGEPATVIDASILPSNATIEVTATSGSVSKSFTATKNIGPAGVALVRSTGASAAEFDSVQILGDVVGKKVFVALVDDSGKIYQILTRTLTAEDATADIAGAYRVGLNGPSFCSAADAIGKSLKVFILDENLKPCSMPYFYNIKGVRGTY